MYALKLRADCCRYWAEETAGENKRELAERSQYAYQQAWVGTWMRVAIGGLRVVASLTAGSNGCIVLEGFGQEHALLVTASGTACICATWVVVGRQGVAVASMCINMCCTAHDDVVQVSSYTHESGVARSSLSDSNHKSCVGLYAGAGPEGLAPTGPPAPGSGGQLLRVPRRHPACSLSSSSHRHGGEWMT